MRVKLSRFDIFYFSLLDFSAVFCLLQKVKEAVKELSGVVLLF